MKDINKRLNQLEVTLKRQKDPVYTVTLTDGSKVVCSYETAWDYFKLGQGHLVASVDVDRPDYIENAGLLAALCGAQLGGDAYEHTA